MDKIENDQLKLFELELLKRDIYGYLTPTDNEVKIMDLVANTVKKETPLNNLEERNFKEEFEKGMLSLVVFNKRFINKVNEIPFITYDDLDENDLRTIISFNIMSKFRRLKGKNKEVKIPNKINELFKVWVGHELVHCLKDTNYHEYVLKDIASETLPIFYEMLITHTLFEDVHDKWKNYRLSFLSDHIDVYQGLEKNDEYEILKNSYGQYLTSYYYALNIYHLYKEDPIKMTKYINKVLTNKKTTLDLLKEFNIYEINKEHVNIYKLEHSKL